MNEFDIDELRLIGAWLNETSPDTPEDLDGDRVIAAADEIERLQAEIARLSHPDQWTCERSHDD